MRAVGRDMDVAGDAGIKGGADQDYCHCDVHGFAGLGMVIYLQNMGNISTYSSPYPDRYVLYCSAACGRGHPVIGHRLETYSLVSSCSILMFIVAPSAGAKITGDSMIGEYFRVFISYEVLNAGSYYV